MYASTLLVPLRDIKAKSAPIKTRSKQMAVDLKDRLDTARAYGAGFLRIESFA
jgi:hypothetical protein